MFGFVFFIMIWLTVKDQEYFTDTILVKKNEFPFMVLLVMVEESHLTEKPFYRCMGCCNAVLINEKTILAQYGLFIIKEDVDEPLSTWYGNKCVTHGLFYKGSFGYFPDIYVVHGKRVYDFHNQACIKVVETYPKLNSFQIIPHNHDDNTTRDLPPYIDIPQYGIGILDKPLVENGKDIMYVDLYDEDEHKLKGNYSLLVGALTFESENYIERCKMRKLKLNHFLDCNRCLLVSRFYNCNEKVFGCEVHFNYKLDNSYGGRLFKYGSALLWGRKERKKRWIYYGLPVTRDSDCEKLINYQGYEHHKSISCSKILSLKVSNYVDWIWKNVEKPPPFTIILSRYITFSVLSVMFLLCLICCLIIFTCLIILIRKRKRMNTEKEENEIKPDEKKEEETQQDLEVTEVMGKYVDVPKWMKNDV